MMSEREESMRKKTNIVFVYSNEVKRWGIGISMELINKVKEWSWIDMMNIECMLESDVIIILLVSGYIVLIKFHRRMKEKKTSKNEKKFESKTMAWISRNNTYVSFNERADFLKSIMWQINQYLESGQWIVWLNLII